LRLKPSFLKTAGLNQSAAYIILIQYEKQKIDINQRLTEKPKINEPKAVPDFIAMIVPHRKNRKCPAALYPCGMRKNHFAKSYINVMYRRLFLQKCKIWA